MVAAPHATPAWRAAVARLAQLARTYYAFNVAKGGSKQTKQAGTKAGGKRNAKDRSSGKLRIGDHWNAIRIIALSQTNPLKAIAEFVENSIDAKARNVSIVRGKHKGEQYLKVVDDGEGVADFHYLATHIGDSIKRKLKEKGQSDLQGEFGIGLLSFWTVGEELVLTSKAADGAVKRLHLVKDDPGYSIRDSRELFDQPGTTLHIAPLLSGVRMLSGEKIQSYLASELRDRIRKSGVSIRIIDRGARKELAVEPRRFTGQLLHELPEVRSPYGEIIVELYLTVPGSGAGVALYKQGTRVLADITATEAFRRPPWTTGYVEGIIDASFLQLTPGTRDGVVYDAAFDGLVEALAHVEEELSTAIEERRRAEEEEASRTMLRRITRAFKEAFAMLPSDEYGWLGVRGGDARSGGSGSGSGSGPAGAAGPGGSGDEGEEGTAGGASAGEDGTAGGGESEAESRADSAVGGVALAETQQSQHGDESRQEFFEFPGPLYRLDIRPASARVPVAGRRKLHAVPRDRSKRTIDADVEISWYIEEGHGTLDTYEGEFAAYLAPPEPELAVVVATARAGEGEEEIEVEAKATLTVTASLTGAKGGESPLAKQGLPGYTYRYAPGELWRSTYDVDRSLITVNTGHADFVFASRRSATKLRYVARLFAKEIVLANFPGASREELLERMVELGLYMEQNLR
ncbi:MAG: ATP-binding protein [Spirochaetia bacterium]